MDPPTPSHLPCSHAHHWLTGAGASFDGERLAALKELCEQGVAIAYFTCTQRPPVLGVGVFGDEEGPREHGREEEGIVQCRGVVGDGDEAEIVGAIDDMMGECGEVFEFGGIEDL